MRAASALVAAAVAVASVAAAVSAAATPQIFQASAGAYPSRAYILSLPRPMSLSASQVSVTENGAPVAGVTVTRQGAAAQSSSAVVLELDASQSMAGAPERAALAGVRAFAAAANPDEQVAVVSFNKAIRVLQPLTTNVGTLDAALATSPTISYGTPIYDALERGLALVTAAHVSSGVIVIVTDGQNVGSLATPAAALAALARAHVRVFSVGTFDSSYDAPALKRMATATGGSYVEATTPAALRPLLAKLGSRLGSEYLLAYDTHTNPGSHVDVAVSIRGVGGVARSAYVTPALTVVSAAPYTPSSTARIIESPVAMALVVLAVLVLVVFALVNASRQRSDPLIARVGGFVSVGGDLRNERQPDSQAGGQNGPSRRSLLNFIQRSVTRQSWSNRLNATLELADIRMSGVELIALAATGTIAGALILDLLLGVFGVVIAVIVGPVGTRWYVLLRVKRKRSTFGEQLPDNLDVLASALRAGHSLVSALTVVADDALEPSKSEYRRVLAEERLGVPLDEALKDCAIRMANRDLEQVALVARLQREMGSNAAEVLDRVIETVRGRMELRRLAQTLTAQGRFSRLILTGLPGALALLLFVIDPGYMHPLIHKAIGVVLLIGAIGFVALGSFLIGKIVDIKV